MGKSWHSKSLGDGEWAPEQAALIATAFAARFAQAGQPPEMAVFTPHEEGRLHCEVMAYFSPAAAGLAAEFSARTCPKPERAGLVLLSGAPACWEILFPTQ